MVELRVGRCTYAMPEWTKAVALELNHETLHMGGCGFDLRPAKVEWVVSSNEKSTVFPYGMVFQIAKYAN